MRSVSSPLDLGAVHLLRQIEEGSYVTENGAFEGVSRWERTWRWFLSWLPCIDSTTQKCARRTIACIAASFSNLWSETRGDRKEQLRRSLFLCSLAEEDLAGALASLKQSSAKAHAFVLDYLANTFRIDRETIRPHDNVYCDLAAIFLRPEGDRPPNFARAEALLRQDHLVRNPRAIFLLAVRYFREERLAEALFNLRKAASLNYPPAQLKLGQLYHSGYNKGEFRISKDPALAEQLIRQAAEAGDAKAQVALSRLEQKRGSAADALIRLERKAHGGSADAETELAMRLFTGTGATVDVARGLRLLMRATARGHTGALATMLQLQRPAPSSALVPYRPSTSSGEASAEARMLTHVGKELLRWDQFEPRLARASLAKAEEAGDKEAAYFLGFVLSNKLMRYKESRAAYERSAESGDVRGEFEFARCLLYGTGGREEPKRGIELLQGAARKRYVPALCELAMCYIRGIGVEKDSEEAKRLFAHVLKSPNPPPEALVELGLLLLSEDSDDTRNALMATQCFYKAAENRNVTAYLQLAKLSHKGIPGITVTPADGFRFCLDAHRLYREQKAKRQQRFGLGEPPLVLAEFYERGIGCERNQGRALDLYLEAARDGNQKAWHLLEEEFKKEYDDRLPISAAFSDKARRARNITKFIHKVEKKHQLDSREMQAVFTQPVY